MSELLKSAEVGVELLELGFSLHYLGKRKANGKIDPKAPREGKWKHLQTRAQSINRFKRIPAKYTGIGLICGFNDLECIDVDSKHITDKDERLDFEKNLFTLFEETIDDFYNKVVVVRSISGGFHLLYQAYNIEGNQDLAKFRDIPGAIIETRGIGGYCAMYTDVLHGKSYTDIDFIAEDERNALINVCKQFDYKPIVEKQKNGKNKDFESVGLTPWEDYNQKNNVLDLIADEMDVISENNRYYEVLRHGAESSRSGVIFKDKGALWLFSTGTIYPSDTLLFPFQIYAHKNHFGDFSQAAKELYNDGYGERHKTEQFDEADELETLNSEQFPIDVFPKPVIKYIKAVHKESGTPIDFLASAVLFIYSVICGSTYGLKSVFGGVQFPSLWICMITGTGRFKSPAIKRTIMPLDEIENRMFKEFIKAIEDVNQMKANNKKGQKVNADDTKEPVENIMYVENTTFEALADDLQNNPHGIGYIKDELKGMMNQFNKYSGGDNDMSQWLEIWNGGTLKLRRKQAKKARIKNVYVPLIGGIQPEVIHSIIDDENKSSGFVDRFLFVSNYDDMPMLNDFEMNHHIERQYINHMVKGFETMSQAKKNSILYLTDNAKNEIRDFCNEARAKMNANNMIGFDGMYAKSQSYIHRITALCHLMHEFYDHQGSKVSAHVDEIAVERAKKIMGFFESHGIHTRNKQSVDLEKRKALKFIEMKGAVTKKQKAIELFKQYSGAIKYDEIAKLVGYNSKQAVYSAIRSDNTCSKLMASRKN